MSEPVEESSRHLGIAEDGRPFTKGEVRGDDDRCPLVESADQVEEKLTASLGEREVAQFVHDDEVEPAGDVPTRFFELAKIAASGRLGHNGRLDWPYPFNDFLLQKRYYTYHERSLFGF